MITRKTPSSPRGLYKRGDIWYSRIAGADGKLIRKRLSADKQTAIIMLGEMRKTAELQKAGILPDNVEEEVKYCKVLKQKYIERLKTLGRSTATITAYLAAWKYVIEDNKLTHIDQITVSRMEELAERLKAKGTRAQSINMYIGVVKSALTWARDFEYIRRNPLARWESLKKDAARKRRDFTPEEIERIFTTEQDREFRLRWLLYFRTGLRASAGMEARWDWILWDEKAMLLPAEHNKSGVDFWLPLDSDLFEALRSYRDFLHEDQKTGRIFQCVSLPQMRKRFYRICSEAGIDLEGICLHSIRHTFATMSFESSGNNVKAVQELLCHAEGATTMRYIHASAHQKRETVERNARWLQRHGDDGVRATE